MKYLTQLENTPAQQWQAELLIRSFKRQGVADDLVIAVAPTGIPHNPDFCHGLFAHPHLHAFQNVEKVRKVPGLNFLYALRTAAVEHPFLAFRCDCVLRLPLTPLVGPRVAFQTDLNFTDELVLSKIPALESYWHRPDGWAPVGHVFYFDGVPETVFDRAIFLCEMLAFEQARVGDIWPETWRAALAVVFAELSKQVTVEGVPHFESSLNPAKPIGNLVSYRDGLPGFHKRMYGWPVCLGDPFAAVAGLRRAYVGESVNYLSEMAEGVTQ